MTPVTIDEQVNTALEAVTGRLRDEIARELRLVAVDVAATVHRERKAAAHEAAIAAARDLASIELVATARLTDAVRGLDRATSLSDILESLVASAGREASRIALLLTGHGAARGWRFLGFGQAFDAASTISFPIEASSVIAEAIRTGSTVSTDRSAGGLSAPPFAPLPPGRESVVAPVTMSGEVVAVLYADQGPGEVPARESAPRWPDAIEVLARHAARCLEALTALKAVRVLTERPELENRKPEVVRRP